MDPARYTVAHLYRGRGCSGLLVVRAECVAPLRLALGMLKEKKSSTRYTDHGVLYSPGSSKAATIVGRSHVRLKYGLGCDGKSLLG